jgi:hypothetical protein
MRSESEWLVGHSIYIADELYNGKLKVGDLVYCSKELRNVSLLVIPSKEELEEFIRLRGAGNPASLTITYKTRLDKVKSCPVACISKIPIGLFSSMYFLPCEDLERKERLKYLARIRGLNVIIKSKNKGKMFTIYGDNEQELKDFVFYACEKGYLYW